MTQPGIPSKPAPDLGSAFASNLEANKPAGSPAVVAPQPGSSHQIGITVPVLDIQTSPASADAPATTAVSAGPDAAAVVTHDTNDNGGGATVVGYVGANEVGAAQQYAADGTYAATASTSGAFSGNGSAQVNNTPSASTAGSNATGSAQWASPDGAFSLSAQGGANFKNMQVPTASGGVTVTTPWGTYTTPPLH